jgi:hypothetical protein
MTQRPRLGVVPSLLAGFLVLACASAPAGTPNASPGASPNRSPGTSPATGAIEHPTGATDVVLRYEQGGGFVAPGFLITEAPWFTLYGDGTTIFRDPTTAPPAGIGPVARSAPFLAVRLSEEQVQSLLQFAIGAGGLGLARDEYQLPVADAPTTTFTLQAGGLHRRVSVNGLGISVNQPGSRDTQILLQLAALRAHLGGFASAVDGEQPWLPDRYRGVLMENVGGDASGAVNWPWPAIEVSDFTRDGEASSRQFPTRVMTPAEVAALAVGDLEGGATGFVLRRPPATPVGPPYLFGLRVLLPDEIR